MDISEFRIATQVMFKGIERELQLARVRDEHTLRALGGQLGGGNLLAAIGLLCYTEFGGKLKFDCRKPDGADDSAENFNRFFDELGPGYAALRASGRNIYAMFRCGLAHEYFTKRCNFTARLAPEIPAAIHQWSNGGYVFALEQYCHDLRHAFDRLEQQLFGSIARPSA